MALSRHCRHPIQTLSEVIDDRRFQNYCKCMLALHMTKKALCAVVERKWKLFISKLTKNVKDHLETFVRCLGNEQKTPVLITGMHLCCCHKLCQTMLLQLKALLDGLSRHTDISLDEALSSETCLRYYWDIAKLFIFEENKLRSKQKLTDLDISQLIEMMGNCKLFAFDNSDQILSKIRDDRKYLIHSTNNKMTEEEMSYFFTRLQKLLAPFHGLKFSICTDTSKDLQQIQLKDHTNELQTIDSNLLIKKILEIKKEALEADMVLSDGDMDNLDETKRLLVQINQRLDEQEEGDEDELMPGSEMLIRKELFELEEDDEYVPRLENKRLTEQVKLLTREMEQLKSKVTVLQDVVDKAYATGIHSETRDSDGSMCKRNIFPAEEYVQVHSPGWQHENTQEILVHEQILADGHNMKSISKPSLSGQQQQLKVFEEPQCLIETDKFGQLAIIEETKDELMKINLTLNVIAITGIYRTGKSYLMNRLANHSPGFALGKGIKPTTKGIWVLCKIHPTQKDQVLVLLDTEGLGDVEKGSLDHDNKLFILATLLSSTLVYNVMSAFSQDTVERLTFIAGMSKLLRVSYDDNSDDNFDIVMPEFVLCIRDFALNLMINGKECSEDEYLDHCLKEKQVMSTADEKYNRTQRCFKKYFTKRKAFTFDRPGSRKVMQNLNVVRDKDLSQDFIMETDKFKSYIYECPPKMLPNKRPVTGSMFAKLITQYIHAMRAGKEPCIDDAVTAMSKAENERHAKAAIAKYTREIWKIKLPVPNKSILLTKCIEHQTSILKTLHSELLFDDNHSIERSAQAKMEQLYQKLEDENSRLLYEKCMCFLTNLYDKEIKVNSKSKKYMVAGGYEIYKCDRTRLLKEYTNQLTEENVDPAVIQRVGTDFLAHKTSESEQIMVLDMNITAKERQEEIKRREKEMKHEETQKREKARYDDELKRQNKRHEDEMEPVRKAEEEKDKANTAAYFEERLARRDNEIRQLSVEVGRLEGTEGERCLLM